MSIKKLFALSLLLVCPPLLGRDAGAQTNDRARAAAEIESLREQIKAREAVLLSVPREDQERYAEFLRAAGHRTRAAPAA